MDALLTIAEAAARLGIARSTLYAHISECLVPSPVRVSRRRVAFLATEIDAVLRARAAGYTDGDIKEMVASAVLARQTRTPARPGAAPLTDNEIDEDGNPLSPVDLEFNRQLEPILAQIVVVLRRQYRDALARELRITPESLHDAAETMTTTTMEAK